MNNNHSTLALKTFNQSINTSFLDDLSELIKNNYDAFAHAYAFKVENKKKHRFEYFNLMETCIIRIRETAHYLSNYEFKQVNICGQAFDFYEFINCLSIIFSCTESILSIFEIDLKEYFKNKSHFAKSNNTKENDYKFFKFIRSAAVAHPDNTSRYNKITKRKNEIYPYAVWTHRVMDLLIKEKDRNADISLLSWASSERSQYKRYYLYICEFFSFINAVTLTIKDTLPKAIKIANEYKEKHRCKRLKKESDFNNYHDYMMYLRNRLHNLNTLKDEFPDGGLLVADHILSNPIIGDTFKLYIKDRVNILRYLMINDYDQIGFDTIFDELDIYRVIKKKCHDSGYIAEKFSSYLRREAMEEIENGIYNNFYYEFVQYKDKPSEGSDAFWAVYKLLSCDLFLNMVKSCQEYRELCYADIYEMSLEIIYEETLGKGN